MLKNLKIEFKQNHIIFLKMLKETPFYKKMSTN